MFTNTKLTKSIRLAMAVSVASTVLISSNAVFAQETSSLDEVESTEIQDRIQVTGSRIRTDSFASDSPIDIISIEEAEQGGLKTVGELLRTSTAAAGSSQLIGALGVGFVTDGGAGTETVSLRGLGANRTLVLLNGRRAGPAGTKGAVSGFDLNTIPLSAVERIEVLKDGASSLYGSDAVAGVINIITKKGDSKSVTVDISQPQESGGEDKRINFTWGEEFSKGSIRATVDYRKTSELVRGDRDFLDCTERLYTAADGSSADPIDPRTGKAHCSESGFGIWLAGVGATNVASGMQLAYDYDGFFAANGYDSMNDTASAAGDLTTPDGFYPVSFGGETEGWWSLDHPFRDNRTMSPENTTYSAMVTGEYQLTDDILGYAEFLHTSRNTKQRGYRQFWNADVGFQFSSQYDGFDGDAYLLTVALTDHYSQDVTVDYTRAVIGATGSIGFWDWDISFQNSYNDGEYINDIILSDSLVMSQFHVANGTTCSGEVTEFSGKTCVDLPWTDPEFLYGNHTAEQREFIYGQDIGNTIYKQRTLEGYITGDLYELPAGEVGAAFGFSIQKDEIDDTPGENTLNGNSWGLSGAGRTAGSQISRAIFGELKIPILEDITGIKALDGSVSARWTDVNTYGSDTTFKVGLNWTIIDGLNIRMNRGSSFRSPALFELFLADQTGFGGQLTIDPCLDYVAELAAGNISDLQAANCSVDVPEDYTIGGSSALLVTSGGAGRLEAETSVNENIGIVWTSPEDTYAFSIDYYDIRITGEVASLGGSDVTNGCYTSVIFSTEPLCDLITRRDGSDNNDFGVEEVRGGYINVADQVARGIDYNFSYDEEFGFGSIRLSLEHTMQIERTFKLFEDSDENNYIGENGNPKHTGNVRLTYTSNDDYSVTWTANYYDSTNDYEYYSNGNQTTFDSEPVTFVDETPWVTYHSVSGYKSFENGFDVTIGIANLFDKAPPIISSAGLDVGNAALYSQYDFVGRRFFANVEYNF
jgi:outer membrane receptor protein involved in Fe transport